MMRRSGACFILGLAAASANGADNSLGKWKLNVERSRLEIDNVPVLSYFKSETMIREGRPGGIKVLDSFEAGDRHGTVTYEVKYDGTASALAGVVVWTYQGAPASAGFDRISIRQLDANTFVSERQNTATQFHATGRIAISHKGKVMTEKTAGISNDGKKFSMNRVFEKQ